MRIVPSSLGSLLARTIDPLARKSRLAKFAGGPSTVAGCAIEASAILVGIAAAAPNSFPCCAVCFDEWVSSTTQGFKSSAGRSSIFPGNFFPYRRWNMYAYSSPIFRPVTYTDAFAFCEKSHGSLLRTRESVANMSYSGTMRVATRCTRV